MGTVKSTYLVLNELAINKVQLFQHMSQHQECLSEFNSIQGAEIVTI